MLLPSRPRASAGCRCTGADNSGGKSLGNLRADKSPPAISRCCFLTARAASGNVHSADEWEELPIPEIVRRRKLGKQVAFRADVAFGEPDIYEAAELQDSGYPFPDWNARITAKCYAPIGHARIVDDKAGTSSTAKYWVQLHWWRVCRLTQNMWRVQNLLRPAQGHRAEISR